MTLGELVCAIMGCLDFELRLNSVLYIRRINSLAWITMTVNIWFQSISLEKISPFFVHWVLASEGSLPIMIFHTNHVEKFTLLITAIGC